MGLFVNIAGDRDGDGIAHEAQLRKDQAARARIARQAARQAVAAAKAKQARANERAKRRSR